MNIGVRDTLTLNGKDKYVVAGKITYKDDTYYYLVSLNNELDVKFCLHNKNNITSLTEVIDPDIIEELLPLFCKSGIEFLSNNVDN